MSTPQRKPDSSVEATSPRQRYRSSSFSSDIPIGSPVSNHGGPGSDYLSPMSITSSPSSRPGMPHSASLPTLMGQPDESPFESTRSRRSSLSSNHSTSTPTKQKSTYNHPYLIHSSSSAVLSRTNTSPVVNYTALPPSTPGHRSSRSMGLLRTSQSVDDLRSPEKPGSGADETKSQTKGGSGYTSYTPPVRRKLVNRYSVSNLSDLALREGSDTVAEKESERKTGKLDMGVWEWKMGPKVETVPTRDLPPNPKLWNAHETAHYIAHCLSHGINPNPDSRTGITKLPPMVVQDITEWIKRGRVTGKGFLMGGEGSWASSSKPPPFMDVLLSLSRNLRRASLKGNIAGISWQPPSASDRGNASATSSVLHNRDTSVLEEANEDDDEEEDEVQPSSNVKRLAHDFDTRSISSMSTAGSEISEDDMLERARPRSGRTFSTNSQQSQRSREEIAEQARRFERGLAEIGQQPGHDVKANFGHLVDTVQTDDNRALWDSAVAEGGLRPDLRTRDSTADAIVDRANVKSGIEPAAIGLGIFDGPVVNIGGQKTALDQVEEEHKLPVFHQSPLVSPPPAYTSPQFGNTLADGDINSTLPDSDSRAIDEPSKHVSYGLLGHPGDSLNLLKPRLPTMVDRRGPSLLDSSGQGAETPLETDADDSRDLGRRVTLRPTRVLSAVHTPTRHVPTGSGPDLEADRSGSVTPSMPHPSEKLLSQAQETIDELQERLRATELEVARLESALRESQQRKPVIAPVPNHRKDTPSPSPSNHQALALLYGGLAGLCISVLVLKTFGRKAGSF